MYRFGIGPAAAVALLVIAAGCGGGSSITDELHVVPGLCFLHVHLSGDMDISLVPGGAEALLPVWLVDSLHSRGGLGISLLGVNLTDLSPQLLFLSRHVDPDEMAKIGEAGFDCEARETEKGYDLVDSRGSVRGSVAGRDGWTALVTGSGADRSASRWLTMEEGQSLAADSDLMSIAESDADMTVLVSRNSISFLSVIPTGMLSRQQMSYLNIARNIIADLGLSAAGLCFDVTEVEPGSIEVQFRFVRDGGHVSEISLCFSDTGIPPDSAVRYLTEWYGIGGRGLR